MCFLGGISFPLLVTLQLHTTLSNGKFSCHCACIFMLNMYPCMIYYHQGILYFEPTFFLFLFSVLLFIFVTLKFCVSGGISTCTVQD